MRSRPPKNKIQTSIHSYTQTYFKFSPKIPNSERFCKNFVNKGIQSIYFHINKKRVFIWYMLNLYYKSMHFILIRKGF